MDQRPPMPQPPEQVPQEAEPQGEWGKVEAIVAAAKQKMAEGAPFPLVVDALIATLEKIKAAGGEQPMGGMGRPPQPMMAPEG